MRQWVVAALLLLAFPVSSPACIVGQMGQTPAIDIVSHPGDCCYDRPAGDIIGTAANVDTASAAVVIYVRTNNVYNLQSAAAPWSEVSCVGGWRAATNGGNRYMAILASREWIPPLDLTEVPYVDGSRVLAVARDPVRTIDWAGYRWEVESARDECILPPGPNCWSDSSANVFVQGGELHLKLTHVDGKWYSAKIRCEQPLGYGQYLLRLSPSSPIDRLDPNVVLDLFTQGDANRGVGIEFASYGASGALENSRFVIQPDTTGRSHAFDFAAVTYSTLHYFCWFPDRVDFNSFNGSGLVANWTFSGSGVPPAGDLRPTIALWLFNGVPPGGEVEVILEEFYYDGGGYCVTPAKASTWGSIKAKFR